MKNDELDFLKSYNLEDYARPSVATDMTIFTIGENTAENYRKLPEKYLKILLVKRNEHPFKDKWVLPGGFLRKDESIKDAAKRELFEETGVENAFLKNIGVFDEKGRDPRGWIISCLFTSLINSENIKIRATSDVCDAKWFRVRYDLAGEFVANNGHVCQKYNLIFESEDEVFCCEISKVMKLRGYTTVCEYVVDSSMLGFDHAKLVAYAIEILRNNVENSTMAFELLPEKFTLTELQNIYEVILNKKLFKANFREKIQKYVVETSEMAPSKAHRPSKLYVRNLENFLEIGDGIEK